MLCQKCESELCKVVELEKIVNEAKAAAAGHKNLSFRAPLFDAWHKAEQACEAARMACSKRYSSKKMLNRGKKNAQT